MKPLAKITLFGALAALGYGCSTDAPTALTAAMTSDDAPAYGPWSAPVNLGPPINSAANEMNAALSADELSLYFVSNRAGGLGAADIWVSRRASLDGHADRAAPGRIGREPEDGTGWAGPLRPQGVVGAGRQA